MRVLEGEIKNLRSEVLISMVSDKKGSYLIFKRSVS